MSIRLVSETDAVTVAWEAFDREALELQRMYREGSYLSAARREQSMKVVRLWDVFRVLLAQADEPRPAA